MALCTSFSKSSLNDHDIVRFRLANAEGCASKLSSALHTFLVEVEDLSFC